MSKHKQWTVAQGESLHPTASGYYEKVWFGIIGTEVVCEGVFKTDVIKYLRLIARRGGPKPGYEILPTTSPSQRTAAKRRAAKLAALRRMTVANGCTPAEEAAAQIMLARLSK